MAQDVKFVILVTEDQGCQEQKNKKAKFGHMQFQKRPNPQK